MDGFGKVDAAGWVPGTLDAHHVAAVLVVAGSPVSAGDRLVFIGPASSGRVDIASGGSGAWVGVADPFLDSPVMPGQVFWCCLRPGTVSDLVHSFKISGEAGEAGDDENYYSCKGCD